MTGDNGGPLTAGGILIGVVSWGHECGMSINFCDMFGLCDHLLPNSIGHNTFPGVYSRVSAVRSWITQHTQI